MLGDRDRVPHDQSTIMTAASPHGPASPHRGQIGYGGLITFGETMGLLSCLDTGPIEYARTFGFGIGGAESNVAIGVVRLGVPATWIGRVGHDATGELIDRRLTGEGVTTMAIRDPSYTGIMVKHRRFGAALTVDYHRAGSAGSKLSSDDLPAEIVTTARMLHVTGITPALSESARDTTFAAVRLANDAGVPVSVDVNYRRKLWPTGVAAPVLRDLVEYADLVFAGREEAEIVTGSPEGMTSEQLARALSKLAGADAIIKDGSRGCTAVIGTDLHVVPALRVLVVDAVGAGDSFVAGYLSELLLGEPPDRRLATAITAGAFTVTVHGDCEGLPRRGDLEPFVRSLGNDGEVRR
jgi:2-dehydro-3-deoxygluconokinase